MKPNPAEILPSTYGGDFYLWAYAPNYRERAGSRLASGKWLVFVHVSYVDRYWELIRDATEAGRLGHCAKVATAMPSPLAVKPDLRVVCVYTCDTGDEEVRRVLHGIRALGISWWLSYKTDAATRAGRYGPRSTLYVSPPGSDDFYSST